MITCSAFHIISLGSNYSLGELKQEIANASSVVPDEFNRIKRIAKDSNKQHSTSMETCKDLAHLSINDDHERKLADMFRAMLNPLFFGTVVLCGAGWAGKSLAG